MQKPLFLCRSGVVSALALIAAIPVGAGAQTLPDALVSAYNNNPQLQAERATLRATDEAVPQALANWRPTVQLSVSGGIQHDGIRESCAATSGGINLCTSTPVNGQTPPALLPPPNLTTTDNLSPQTYGLTIQQPLYRGGRTEAQTQQALSQVRAERAHLVSIEQTVLLSAVSDYMNVVRDQAVLDLNINNEQVLRRQLEAAQDRFRVGEVTRTDVAQAEAAYAQAIAGRETAEGTLQISRAGYERDIGELPGKLVAPQGIPELPTSREESTSTASTSNPDVISAQFAQEAAEDTVRLVRGQLLPTVTLNASIQHAKENSTVGLAADSVSLIAQATMPLYEGGVVYSQSRQAQQTVAQRKSQVDDARRAAIQASAQAWEQLKSDRATIVSLQSQIRAAEIALDGVQQEAAVGSRTVLDILNQEQALFQSRVNLVVTQHDEVVAEFALASALGRLTAKHLNLPVTIYDPDKNFDTVRGKWIGFGTGEQ
jgi:outer membrane protein